MNRAPQIPRLKTREFLELEARKALGDSTDSEVEEWSDDELLAAIQGCSWEQGFDAGRRSRH